MVLVLAAVMAAASPTAAQSAGSQPQAQADALAIWRARQAALQAEAEANMAAAKAGEAQGTQIAKEGSLREQFKMVNAAVKGWKAPRQYSAASAASVSTLQDPFAPAIAVPQPADVPTAALGTSGLVWDADRKLARVGTSSAQLCGGRLKVGDYPALPDGNLLDTPARITKFLSACSDPSSPLMVIVPSGEIAVRK
jgi:hypothetical protein